MQNRWDTLRCSVLSLPVFVCVCGCVFLFFVPFWSLTTGLYQRYRALFTTTVAISINGTCREGEPTERAATLVPFGIRFRPSTPFANQNGKSITLLRHFPIVPVGLFFSCFSFFRLPIPIACGRRKHTPIEYPVLKRLGVFGYAGRCHYPFAGRSVGLRRAHWRR